MLKSCLATAAVACLALSVSAQQASYDLVGNGCNGGAQAICASQNAGPMPPFTQRSLPNEYGHAALNSSMNPVTVVGFSIYTESVSLLPETIQVGLYEDASGAGAIAHTQPAVNAVANGMLDVAGPLAWYRAEVYPPIVIPPGGAFWISADTNAVRPPDAGAAGVVPVAPSFWRRPPFGGTAWAQTGIIQSPIFEVHCAGSTPIPALINSGNPVIGQSFTLNIVGADPSSLASFLVWGLDNTQWLGFMLPLDMGLFGAQNCTLYISPATTEFLPLVNGSASRQVNIPAGLTSFSFFNQVLEVRPGSTNLGILFSNAGDGVVGN